MPAHIPPDVEAKVLAAYADSGGNGAEAARRCGVSRRTVERVLDRHDDSIKRLADDIKRKQEATMEAYLESVRAQAQEVVSKCLGALADEDKIKRASLVQIATVMGICIDKWGRSPLTADLTVRGGVIEIPAVAEPAPDDEAVQL